MAVSSSRSKLLRLFGEVRSAVIGMVHVQALPGAPRHHAPFPSVVEQARHEAQLYRDCGVDGIIVENMHDLPYLRAPLGPETVASMTRVCCEVAGVTEGIPLGVQVLSGANKEALAVAKACGASFVRAEGFVFSQVGDEGWVDACAGELLRYRRSIEAEDILVFTDVKKKHCSHAVTADVNVAEMAQAAEFFLSDGVVLSGRATGLPTDTEEIHRVKNSINLPVIIGSGVTADNLDEYMTADAMIVGSHFKFGGNWYNEVDKSRVAKFMDRISSLRKQ